MLCPMARRSAPHELNDWLDQHGYRHAHARVQETPHPYVVSPRLDHARILQGPPHSHGVSPRMAHARIIHQEPTGRPVFAAHERDHHITTAGRRALERSQFALPPGAEEKRRGIRGRLPIDDIERARSALARASMMHHRGDITAQQLKQARRAVHRAWPSIKIEGT